MPSATSTARRGAARAPLQRLRRPAMALPPQREERRGRRLGVPERPARVGLRARRRSGPAVALDDVQALVAADVLEHVLEPRAVGIGVWVLGPRPGAEVALAGHDRVGERRY